MESIGEKLRKAREDKQVSLDQVARETNIAKRYLIALEEEDSSQFPGETYALGFLRNYAEYLGLNSAELITLYKNMRLQEQPVPLEALLEKKRSLSPYIIGIVVGILVLGAGVGYYYLRIRTQPKEPAPVVQGVSRVEYRGQLLEQLFIEGDEITFSEPIGTIKVQKIGSTVDLVGIFGKLSMKKGQESLVEVPGSNQIVKVTCSEVKREGNLQRAVLRFELVEKATGSSASATPKEGVENVGTSIPVGTTNEASRVQTSRVILEAATKGPFTLEIEFTGYSFFRYVLDGNEREEKYFRRGETFRVDVQREIYIGFSNAGSLRGRIRGKEFEFGRPGQVGIGILKWVDPPGGGQPRVEFVSRLIM